MWVKVKPRAASCRPGLWSRARCRVFAVTETFLPHQSSPLPRPCLPYPSSLLRKPFSRHPPSLPKPSFNSRLRCCRRHSTRLRHDGCLFHSALGWWWLLWAHWHALPAPGSRPSRCRTHPPDRIVEHLAGCRAFVSIWQARPGLADEVLGIHPPQAEKQLGLLIEACAHAIEHGGHVLAHRGPVRATAAEADFLRRGEQPGARRGRCAPSRPWKASLQQLDHRIDRARAILADGLPLRRGTASTLTSTL